MELEDAATKAMVAAEREVSKRELVQMAVAEDEARIYERWIESRLRERTALDNCMDDIIEEATRELYEAQPILIIRCTCCSTTVSAAVNAPYESTLLHSIYALYFANATETKISCWMQTCKQTLLWNWKNQ